MQSVTQATAFDDLVVEVARRLVEPRIERDLTVLTEREHLQLEALALLYAPGDSGPWALWAMSEPELGRLHALMTKIERSAA